MEFKNRLKILRKEKDYTQKDLAKLLNVTVGSIAMWETGKRFPTTKMLENLSEVLGVNIDYLLCTSDIRSIELPNIIHTVSEDVLIKYSHLDKYGKEAVDMLIDIEYERCTEGCTNN